MKMKILVLGGGGREHALIWAITQNPKCKEIFCAPGNAGIARVAKAIDLNIVSPHQVVKFCRRVSIDFVIIGPEAPLMNGVTDALRNEGILTFGPSKASSRLETSKAFSIEVCRL